MIPVFVSSFGIKVGCFIFRYCASLYSDTRELCEIFEKITTDGSFTFLRRRPKNNFPYEIQVIIIKFDVFGHNIYVFCSLTLG